MDAAKRLRWLAARDVDRIARDSQVAHKLLKRMEAAGEALHVVSLGRQLDFKRDTMLISSATPNVDGCPSACAAVASADAPQAFARAPRIRLDA